MVTSTAAAVSHHRLRLLTCPNIMTKLKVRNETEKMWRPSFYELTQWKSGGEWMLQMKDQNKGHLMFITIPFFLASFPCILCGQD